MTTFTESVVEEAATAWLFSDTAPRGFPRLPLRRRGRPGLPRQPRRLRHRGEEPRAPGRPDAARPADPGRPPRPLGRVVPRLPARMASRPSRPTAAYSSRPPSACTRTCAASSPMPSTTLACTRARQPAQPLILIPAPIRHRRRRRLLPLEHDGTAALRGGGRRDPRALCEPARAALSRTGRARSIPWRGQHLVVAPYNSQVNLLRSVLPPAPASARSTSFRGRKPRRCSSRWRLRAEITCREISSSCTTRTD